MESPSILVRESYPLGENPGGMTTDLVAVDEADPHPVIIAHYERIVRRIARMNLPSR